MLGPIKQNKHQFKKHIGKRANVFTFIYLYMHSFPTGLSKYLNNLILDFLNN